jgi:hypothetical protein
MLDCFDGLFRFVRPVFLYADVEPGQEVRSNGVKYLSKCLQELHLLAAFPVLIQGATDSIQPVYDALQGCLCIAKSLGDGIRFVRMNLDYLIYCMDRHNPPCVTR